MHEMMTMVTFMLGWGLVEVRLAKQAAVPKSYYRYIYQ